LTWTDILLSWYSENKRPFPWRKTKEPYKVWLSEIILQQTRTVQGTPYYERFIKVFPTVKDLALADEDKVLKMWQGLGYYSRARNLHHTARHIHNDCKGTFPNTFEGLIALKGVGDYTASAIASICFNLPEAVVDGNVYRFLSRYFGIQTPINDRFAHGEFKTKAALLMDGTQPGTFNQALMEFGALQCTPKNPFCTQCPFAKKCVAFNQNKILSLPVKGRKIKVTERHFNYLVIQDQNGKILLEKRQGKGIWQNLFQFPLVETSKMMKSKKAFVSHLPPELEIELDLKSLKLWNKTPIIHKLSHQKLFVFFWIVPSLILQEKGLSVGDLNKRAVPVVIQNFMKNCFEFQG
jgi:A/G-specific adenine glycosylase